MSPPPRYRKIKKSLTSVFSLLYDATMLSTKYSSKPIAERLREYRLSRELTYEQMGALTGLHHVTIWKIEHGTVNPHDLTVAILERTLPGFKDETGLSQE